jgi:diguanylate cyclase (GGDEF)-like protein
MSNYIYSSVNQIINDIGSAVITFLKLSYQNKFKLLFTVLVILASVRFGSLFSLPPTNISTFWPANAIVLTLILGIRYRFWNIYLIYSFLAYVAGELWIGFELELSLVYALSNCAGITIAAYLIKNSRNLTSVLCLNISVPSFLLYIAFAALLSASISGLFTIYYTYPGQIDLILFIRRWMLADFTGYILFVPILYVVIPLSMRKIKKNIRTYWRDALPIFSAHLLTCLAVVALGLISEIYFPIFFYFPLIIIIWAAFKLGVFGALFAMLIYAMMIIISALNHMGPFSQLPPEENILALQFFIIINVTMLLMILDLIRQRDDYQSLSLTDELTQLANYRSFENYLSRLWQAAIREDFPLTLITIDIDYFKKYNDTYGHIKGNECLRKIADAINNSVSRSTDFVSRVGGEEFSCILSNTNAESSIEVVNRIMSTVHELNIPHETSTISNCVTVSIGVCSMKPVNGSIYAELVNKADESLYEAKNKGRNNWVKYLN